MSLNVTDNGPHIVHPSVCLKELFFLVNVTSVPNFNNKLLNKLVSISFYCISDLKYNQLFHL